MKSLNQTDTFLTVIKSSMLFIVLFCIPDLFAQELPTDPGDVVPGIAADGGAGTALTSLVAWAVTLLAYALMVIAAVGAAWFIFLSFGQAADGRGSWAGFAGTAFGSLVMLTVVVTIGLIAVGWAEGLATFTIA